MREAGYELKAACDSLSPQQETVRERLERRRRQYAQQLDEVNVALALLDKNPAFEECHNAILKAGY